MAKINDPVRAEAYAALGIATVCRTTMMVDVPRAASWACPPTPGAMRVMPPSGHHPGQHRATGRTPAAEPAGGTAGGPALMYVIVVGGGKVGYYLTKELLAAGHELVLLEKDRAARRADRATRSARSCSTGTAARAQHLAEAGANRAAIVAAVTGDDEDNLVVCQMAKHHFDVPRTIARVNNPRNEELFRHLGVDEIISPTRMALAAIEQDIPVHELLHLAQLEGGELELIEAQIGDDSPAIGRARRTSTCPTAARCSCSSATTQAQPIRPDTVFQAGDKVIAITRTECEARPAPPAHRRSAADHAAPEPPRPASPRLDRRRVGARPASGRLSGAYRGTRHDRARDDT